MKLFVFSLFVAAVLSSKVSLPVYPLAVKHPYLSAWFPGDHADSLPSSCPMFWTRYPLTWHVYARVNGDMYSLFGCPDDSIESAEQIDLEFTATHTIVTLRAGATEFVLDFFSPVSLTNYVRQSIPYSYLTVFVKDAPRRARVDIMSAIDDTWTAQNSTEAAFTKGAKSHIYTLGGVDSIPLTEWQDMATYGQIVFAANSQTGKVTHQSGSSRDIKAQFARQGSLSSGDSSYASGDLVALAYALGHATRSATFAIGLERDITIQWLDEPQAAYYQSRFEGTEEVVDHFFADEADARKESKELDCQTKGIGESISSNYTDILEASVRQIWGGFELTVPMDSKDTTKAKAFIKEISTDGNVNTLADLIPKALPVFYMLAPDYIRLFLEPIMEYTLTWPADFAFHDLGKHYPNATGETVEDQEKLIMDQTSVIHWMTYSYQKATGDTEWVKPYVSKLQVYADHLVKNGLYPPSERSSVDSIGATPNQTVLAIYSAIGLTAFGAMTGQSNYTDKGKEYAELILEMGYDSEHTHVRAHYNDSDSSWISTYPFGFDKMLELDTFNSSTHATQSDWYEQYLHPYGLQLYDGVDYMVAELAMWGAATSSNTVRDAIIDGIHRALTNGLNEAVGPTQWNVTGPNEGLWFLSTAKSIVGSYWMPALFA